MCIKWFHCRKPWRVGIVAAWSFLVVVPLSYGSVLQSSNLDNQNIFQLSLEELGQLKIGSFQSTLFPTNVRHAPNTVYPITAFTITQSGSRTLNELLEIHVPNVQLIRHHPFDYQVGIRGLVSDIDEKYLFRVNGRILNQRLLVGVQHERNMPLLGEIRRVDVVKGPGSATFGPGAISGAINLETYTGLTFTGAEVISRYSAIFESATAELRYGKQFGNNAGVFLYYGIADVEGADQDDSKYFFSRSFDTPAGFPDVTANEAVEFPIVNDGSSFRDQLQHKVFADLVVDNYEFWFRYTTGGYFQAPFRQFIALPPNGIASNTDDLTQVRRGFKWNQITVAATTSYPLLADLTGELFLSYDWFQSQQRVATNARPAFTWVADDHEFNGRVLLHYTGMAEMTWGVGAEYSYQILRHHSTVASNPDVQLTAANTGVWSTHLGSIFGEHNWTLSDTWATHLSGRIDFHTYSKNLYSPRGTILFHPTPDDTFKLIGAQGNRWLSESTLRILNIRTGKNDFEGEQIQSIELRYDHYHHSAFRGGLSLYYERSELVGFIRPSLVVDRIGVFKIFGIEADVQYQDEIVNFRLAHSYTKLLDATLFDENSIQVISAHPYGFGQNLTNIANHFTQASLLIQASDAWMFNTSLRVYWGFPGGQDLANYNASRSNPVVALPLTDPGNDKAFQENVYWNVGTEYRPSAWASIRLDLYNILGWVDGDLNKRNYYARVSAWREESPAIGLTVKLVLD